MEAQEKTEGVSRALFETNHKQINTGQKPELLLLVTGVCAC